MSIFNDDVDTFDQEDSSIENRSVNPQETVDENPLDEDIESNTTETTDVSFVEPPTDSNHEDEESQANDPSQDSSPTGQPEETPQPEVVVVDQEEDRETTPANEDAIDSSPTQNEPVDPPQDEELTGRSINESDFIQTSLTARARWTRLLGLYCRQCQGQEAVCPDTQYSDIELQSIYSCIFNADELSDQQIQAVQNVDVCLERFAVSHISCAENANSCGEAEICIDPFFSNPDAGNCEVPIRTDNALRSRLAFCFSQDTP